MDHERLSKLVKASEAVGTPPTAGQVAGVLTDGELLVAANQRGMLVGEIAITQALTEKPTEQEAGNALATLTPEQQERATALQVAMAEKFSTEETPLSPEDFGVVTVGEGEDQIAVVMLSTGKGLYKGSYNSVMSSNKKNKQDYTIEVDGQEIDTRSAMTWETYQAFIKQAKANGTDPLPDSHQLADWNYHPWPGTWLTGEEAGEFSASGGNVGGGKPRRCWSLRNDLRDNLRVRPAAVV